MTAKAVKKVVRKVTKEEIEQLKDNWLNDPCYDLEDAEGFEAHRTELYIFRLENELHWMRKRHQQLRRAVGDYVATFNNLREIIK